MNTDSHHHVAVRVASIDRSVRFYEEALDATLRVEPFQVDGPFAALIAGEPEPACVRVAMVEFSAGILELFEFVEPRFPTAPLSAARGSALHFGVQVDDVPAALERWEEAGGKRCWPEIAPLGSAFVIYAADPDGNIVELADASMDTLAGIVQEIFG